MNMDELRSLAHDFARERLRGYLGRPFPDALDAFIDTLLRTADDASADDRAEMGRIFGEESSGLLVYAERMAILAVREHSMAVLKQALNAIILEAFRSDYRETLLVLSLVFDAAQKLGLDTQQHFEPLLARAVEPVAQRIRQFAARSPADRSIGAMGYIEKLDAAGLFTYHRTW